MSSKTLLVAIAALSWGCDPALECGAGTGEEDGYCVPGIQEPPECGPGTVYDKVIGLCTEEGGEDEGVCGANTIRVVDENGVASCVGTGETDCSTPPPCVYPASGYARVCGRTYDFTTTQPFATNDGSTTYLGVKVFGFNPLDVMAQGSAAQPVGEGVLDKCGYYDIVVPYNSLGLTAISANDAAEGNEYVDTGITVNITSGGVVKANMFVTTEAENAAWSAANPTAMGGDTVGGKGAVIMIFLDTTVGPDEWVGPFQGKPVSGVTIVSGTSSLPTPDRDFYFADADPLQRLQLDLAEPPALTATMATGAGVLIEVPFGDVTGVGGEPAGCTWPVYQQMTLPGSITIQEMISQCD